MIGNQRDRGDNNNPFADYQQISVQLFTKQEDENDTCFFRVTMKTRDRGWVRIANDSTIGGIPKNIFHFEDEMGGKSMKKCGLSLIDPTAKYIDLVYDKNGDPIDINGKAVTEDRAAAAKASKTQIIYQTTVTDEVCGQNIRLTSSFTYKMKELLTKFSSALGDLDAATAFKFLVLPASVKNPDGSYSKEYLRSKKGNFVVYNMNVATGDIWHKPRLGSTKFLTIAEEDAALNAEYLAAEAQCNELGTGKPLEKFFIRHIDEVLQPAVQKNFTENVLPTLGYELVPTGEVDDNGKEKMKYAPLVEGGDIGNVGYDDADTKDSYDGGDDNSDSEGSADDLPF